MNRYETLRSFMYASYALRCDPKDKASVIKLLQEAEAEPEGTARKRKLDRKVGDMTILLAEEMGRMCQVCPDLDKLLKPCRTTEDKLKVYSVWTDAKVLEDLKDCMSESD